MSWIVVLGLVSAVVTFGALGVAALHTWREARCEHHQRGGH